MLRVADRARFGIVVLVLLVAGACAERSRTPETRPASISPGVGAITRDAIEEQGGGRLGPQRRVELRLPMPGATPGVPTPAQWSDPEAVAALYVLADTTFSAADDPAALAARRSAFATPRLAADLASSSSGGARQSELRRRRARLSGDVLAITTVDRAEDLAVVEVTVASTTTTDDATPDRRVRFYRLTLAWDPSADRWLVAGVAQS